MDHAAVRRAIGAMRGNFMSRLLLAAIALATSLVMPLAATQAKAETMSADPAVREADRQRVIELNTAQARHVEARDRGRRSAPTPAAQNRYRTERERYRAAQAKYNADMAAWRRRVTACEGGDWSQCDR